MSLLDRISTSHGAAVAGHAWNLSTMAPTVPNVLTSVTPPATLRANFDSSADTRPYAAPPL